MSTRLVIGVALPLALLACQNEKAPSEQLKDAATELVEEATGTTAPRLAEGKWAPRDECADIEGASDFRQALAAAVEARDTATLAALSASDIKLDFGGGSGTGQLKARLDGEGRSLWDELDDLLALGCAANGQGGITLPWYFAQDLDGADPFESMMVTGEKIPLLATAEEGAEVLEEISWDVVTLDTSLAPEEPYQKVTAADGKSGYIATDQLRSLVDYRLIASSRDGKWSITSIVAGD